jgi:MFS family permease
VMFVVGSTVAPTLINGNGLVQELVPHDQLTEGLAWIGTALGIGISAGAFVAGLAIDAVGSHGAFLIAVMSGALAVVATFVALPTLRTRADDRTADPVLADDVLTDDVLTQESVG